MTFHTNFKDLILADPRKILSYTLMFCAVNVLLVYLLRVPYWISNQSSLVDEYYVKNFVKSIPMDYVLVLIYLEIGLFISRQLKLQRYFTKRLLVVVLTTALISGGFMLYFLNKPRDGSFFSRWFHSVTWRALVYDMILVPSVFYGFEFLN